MFQEVCDTACGLEGNQSGISKAYKLLAQAQAQGLWGQL